MNTTSAGKCPHCDSAGNVGQACAGELCTRKGYHFIPIEQHTELGGHRQRDPEIGTLYADYLVAGKLGVGGFGTVYLALQLPIMMKAALKVMKLDADEKGRSEKLRRFQSEATSLARLNHPNIVRLVKYDTSGDDPFLVMEFVPGSRTLEREIRQRMLDGIPFQKQEVLHIVGQVLNALASAHEQGIIHRDLKPENIMLQSVKGDELLVRILDFGLAKFLEDAKLSTHIVGTPAFMAPEQLMYKPVGPFTDLYALGVLTLMMLTGRSPFPGTSSEQILAQKLNPTNDPMQRFQEMDFPEPVLRFFRRALNSAPEKRYSDHDSFRDDFQAALGLLSPRALSPPAAVDRKKTAAGDADITAESGAATVQQRRLGGASGDPAQQSEIAAPIEPESRPSLAGHSAAVQDRSNDNTERWRRVAWISLVVALLFAAVVTWTIIAKRNTDTQTPPSALTGIGDPRSSRTLGGKGEEGAYSLVTTRDGGLVFAGFTSSSGRGMNDGWVVALDRDGKQRWQQVLGGARDDEFRSIIQTRDGSLVVAGFQASTVGRFERAWVVRLSADGKILWDRTYAGTRHSRAHRVIQTRDGGFVLAGFGDSKSTGWLLRLDGKGALLWQKEFKKSAAAVFNDVVQLTNGDLVATGYARTDSGRYRDLWLVRVGLSGELRWQRFFGAGWKNKGEGIATATNGDLLVTGYTQAPGSKRKKIWIIRLTKNGKPLWKRSIDSVKETYGNRIVRAGSDFLIAATVEGSGALVLMVSGNDGRPLWKRRLLVPGAKAFGLARFGDDWLVCGPYKPVGGDQQDAFILRLDRTGEYKRW